MTDFSSISTHLIVTSSVLVILFLAFVAIFFIPGLIHFRRLTKIHSSLEWIKQGSSPAEFKKVFDHDKQLKHLWEEYQDTLHEQREELDGQMKLVAVRSTVAAANYFSDQFLVDSRLRTEFFKHLPGIFTGIGIIGTFSGLIDGLRQFKISDDATQVRDSLGFLMNSVGEAFLISAAAIGAAMLVTLLEKMLLAALYRKTESIAHTIDAHFDGGAGEEYLSRLVSASESSASQTKILKDALVQELGDILRELTQAQMSNGQALNSELAEHIKNAAAMQMQAASQDNSNLAQKIAESIKEGLQDPLGKIAESVKTASGEQSSSAVKMLNDVMLSFSQRLNDLFGGQIEGINQLNAKTAQSMQNAVDALTSLVSKLEESGKKTADDMASQMLAAIKSMEERQADINSQTQEFVNQIRKLVEASQSETQSKLQDTLEALGKQMSDILNNLGKKQEEISEAGNERERNLADNTGKAVGLMTSSVESVVKEIAEASRTMAASVTALSSTTAASIDKMNQGATTLNSAASNFAAAGDKVSGVIQQTATVSEKLSTLSGSLTSSSGALQDAMMDYRAQREAVRDLLTEVRAVVENAKRDASLSGEILQRIEASTAKLGQAQLAADEYLDGVSQVLADSSEAFRDSVVSTLSKVNHDFHTKLNSAVGLLSIAVQELEVTLGSLAPAKR